MGGRTQHVVFVFMIISILLLVAGAVMLTLGIIKYTDPQNCAAPSSPLNHDHSDSAVFTSSHVNDINWKPELADSQSEDYKRIAKILENKIHRALEEGSKKRKKKRESRDAVKNHHTIKQTGKQTSKLATKQTKREEDKEKMIAEQKPKVIVNKIEQAPNGGVYVYMTLIFPEGMKNNETLNEVVNSLREGGVNSNLFSDPLAQCEGQPKLPPGGFNQGYSTYPYDSSSTPYPMTTPSDTVSTICFTALPPGWGSTEPGYSGGPQLPEGVTCDVGGRQIASVFLIDVAHPTVGTLEEKLANISSILSMLPYSVNLPVDGSTWPDGVTFQIATYVGGKARNLGEPCTDMKCWQDVVAQLTPANVNPGNVNGHNLATGMEFVLRNIAPSVPANQARSLIVILDSIDTATDRQLSTLTDVLKYQHYFVISALQIGQADSVKARLQNAISDGTHYYYIPSFDWITNPTVVSQIDHWVCDARMPTPSPTSPTLPTTPGLITTEAPPTTQEPEEQRIKAHACALDVLFLVDESQSMLDYGYHISMDMVRTLTDQYFQNHNNSRFALVTFNSALVFSTHRFLPKVTFQEAVSNVREVTGATYFELGFDAARTIIKGSTSRSNKDDVRTVIVFMSDGANGNGTVEKVVGIARDLRTAYQTQIIAIGLNATQDGQRLTKEVIGFGTVDSAVQSSYFNMKSAEEGVTEAVSYARRTVHCKGEDVCGVDLTFVIEVSESELAENVEVQKAAVASTINHFRQSFGPFKARVSLVFFSAPQGLQLSEYGRSGVLYAQLDDAAVAINQTMKRHFILGGASDLKLAMETTRKLLDENDSGNDQMVIVMARGEYQDGQAINCCDDPTESARAVRAKATMQGVVIGGFPNKPLLDKFTSSNSIDGNSLVAANDAYSSGKRIAAELIPLIEEKERNAICAVVPSFILPCQEIVDLVIAIHASTPDSFNTTKYFISRELLPDLFGGRFSALPQSTSIPLNIAVVVYSTLGATTHVRFHDAVAQEELVKKIEKISYPGPGKSRASQAYEETKRVLQRSREGASKVLLMFSDDIDFTDIKKAVETRRSQLRELSYTFGVFVARDRNQRDQVRHLVDHGVLLSTIDQLNLRARRSARNYANQIARAVCRYVGPQFLLSTHRPPHNAMASPPIERRQKRTIRPREVWPDITVLIDTTANFTNALSGMNDYRLEKIRSFLINDLFSQFAIDSKHSRVSIGTFDSTLRLHCKFTDISSNNDVIKCIRHRVSLPDRRTEDRDIERSLSSLESSLYSDLSRGFRPLHKNILLIITPNKISSSEGLNSLKRIGVRPIVIDLDGKEHKISRDVVDIFQSFFKGGEPRMKLLVPIAPFLRFRKNIL